ncbi:uncharacterized protein ACWYII_015514 [Salvelinus alpinus]
MNGPTGLPWASPLTGTRNCRRTTRRCGGSCRTRSERLRGPPPCKDVEVFDQVRLNMDKAHEKKESHRRRIKGTKCFDIWANDLAWKKDERKVRPGKAWCSFAPSWGQHPLRT